MDEWFTRGLAGWYKINKRDLPWRNTNNPYYIWLSEIILQQTQVAQGLAYYERFILKYPSLKHLAAASEDEVLKLWQGLGYYSRARNLLMAAQRVASDYNGVFPQDYSKIRELKGVGDYTAAAVASFAFNLPHAVVDGNVYRLLSRVFGITTPIDSTAGKKLFFDLAHRLLDKKKPALHNQAIMEFGSQFCRPSNPDCAHCIFKHKCVAFSEGKVQSLPVKAKKINVKIRYFNYLVIGSAKGELWIRKRDGNDIWKGLHEFFLLETPKAANPETLFGYKTVKDLLGRDFDLVNVSKTYRHVLSHQVLMATFYVIRTRRVNPGFGLKKTNHKKLTIVAFPRLIEIFLNDCDLKEIL